MKMKASLALSIFFVLIAATVSSQNLNREVSSNAFPTYVKELLTAPPPSSMMNTDPALYKHLLARRNRFMDMLRKAVQDKSVSENILKQVQEKSFAEPAIINTRPSSLTNNVGSTSNLSFHLTKDINQASSSNPTNTKGYYADSFAVMNKRVYYAANDGIHGTELWRSNGMANGTTIVKDINNGAASSNPSNITRFNGKIYFTAYSAENGYELYQSDGTEQGTFSFKNFTSENSSGYISSLIAFKGNLYFTVNGSQLWKTDGTEETTVLVKDLVLSDTASQIATLTVANNYLFFTAYSHVNGYELWRSNGTAQGTFNLTNFGFEGYYSPSNLTSFNNQLYFSASGNAYENYLWISDGSKAGTKPVENNNYIRILNRGSFNYMQNQPFATTKNGIFFMGYGYDGQYRLCKYNPSYSDGAKVVKTGDEILFNGIYTEDLRSMNNNIYFFTNDYTINIWSLWKLNGNDSNSKNIKTASGNVSSYNSFYAFDSSLYFSVYSSGTGYEPWVCDGTTKGTKLVYDINKAGGSYPNYFTLCNGKVFFSAYNNVTGRELWVSNSVADSATEIKNVNTTSTDGTYINYPVKLNNKTLLFVASTPELGAELWKSNGDMTATTLIKDIIPGEGSSAPHIYEAKNGKAYFSAYDPATDAESVFVTDGTSDGTKRLAVVNSYIYGIHAADNGTVFYQASSGSLYSQQELWRTDSTGLNYRIGSGINSDFNVAGNLCFFSFNLNSSGVWRSDGTVNGTFMIMGLDYYTYPSGFTPLNNKMIFRTSYGAYVSDGTSKGTFKLGSVNPFLNYGSAVIDNKLYFEGFDYSNYPGYKIYYTDGTDTGTKPIQNTNPYFSSYNLNLMAVGNKLFFMNSDDSHGTELWKYVATAKKAALVKDINPGSNSSYLNDFASTNKYLYFLDSGFVWQSDGTDEGTFKISDNVLSGLQFVSNLTGVGNKLFLSGTNDLYGNELYAGEPEDGLHVASVNNAVSSKTKTNLSAQIIQNPFYSDLKLTINSPQTQSLQIAVANAAGQTIESKIINASAGSNFVSLNAANWPHGVYIISILSNNEKIGLKAIK